MCIYVNFSGLLIKKDQIPTIEAKELTVLKGPEDIQFHPLPRNNVQMDTENMPIQCTHDGCTINLLENAILKLNLNPVPIQILLRKSTLKNYQNLPFWEVCWICQLRLNNQLVNRITWQLVRPLRQKGNARGLTRTKISWLTNLILASKLVGKKTLSIYLKACCMYKILMAQGFLMLKYYLCNKLPASSLEWISKTNTSTMMWKQGERYNLIRSDKKLWMNELTNWYASISALHICENKNSDLFSLYGYVPIFMVHFPQTRHTLWKQLILRPGVIQRFIKKF